MAGDETREIIAILREGRDMTVATIRPDGAPQATTVSYASDGLTIFFGCAADSQKAVNLARDNRVAITVNLPYQDWTQIRGLSLSGRARRVSNADQITRIGLLFLEKFPEVAQFVSTPDEGIVFFGVTPDVVSILDYRKGFGHTELVRPDALIQASV